MYKTLDIYIIDNIISYLNINSKLLINKKYYNIAKLELNDNVNKLIKFYKYHKLRLQIQFECENYNTISFIHNYYILFYPNQFKINLMYNSLIYLNTTNRIYIKHLYYSSKNNPNIINYNFKIFIKLLNMNELYYLGW
jgi:hypothetical protein